MELVGAWWKRAVAAIVLSGCGGAPSDDGSPSTGSSSSGSTSGTSSSTMTGSPTTTEGSSTTGLPTGPIPCGSQECTEGQVCVHSSNGCCSDQTCVQVDACVAAGDTILACACAGEYEIGYDPATGIAECGHGGCDTTACENQDTGDTMKLDVGGVETSSSSSSGSSSSSTG